MSYLKTIDRYNMKIVYGMKGKSDKNKIFVEETDLNIPIGSESYLYPIDFLKNIQNKKINGIEVYKLFNFDNFSLWWFVYPTIFPSINRILNFIIQFEKILEKYPITNIELVGDIEKWEIIKQICHNKNIKISFSNKKLKFFLLKSFMLSKIKKYYFSYIFKTKINKRLTITKSNNILLNDFHNKIIFASPTVYRRKNSEGDYVKNEYIQGPIMKKLIDMNHELIGIDIDYTFRGDFESLKSRLRDPIPWIPLDLMINNFKSETT
jgi:hypothetical protein